MADNYILLERITVGAAGATSVTFNNIPQSGYTDLKIVISARSSQVDWTNAINLTFNSTRTTSQKRLYGVGSSVVSDSAVGNGQGEGGFIPAATSTASTFSNTEIYIPNYTSSNAKSYSLDFAVENNSSTQNILGIFADLNTITAAISSVTMTSDAGSFVQYSTFSLYALAAVGTTPVVDPKALGGDIIQTDGTYWYHAFLSSGTFTPKVALTCDYLVVAGGGAGGASDIATGSGGGNFGGGGGAGGLRSTVTATGGGGSLESALSLTAQNYTVTIGAGGAGDSLSWTSGNDSGFSTITSVGGGKGGGLATTPQWIGPLTGGSGGGGDEATSTGAAGTTNQGYAGGSSNGSSSSGGGGGGGAGSVGATSTGVGAAGGAGVALSAFATATSTGVSNYYAGGGGGGGTSGGAGGSGGGGAGSYNTAATAGTANTGGGGGSGYRSGASGGSGIVIVRYLV